MLNWLTSYKGQDEFKSITTKQKPQSRQTVGVFYFQSQNEYERNMCVKFTPKNQLKVEGKMSQNGANEVGKKLANAALIFVVGAVFIGLIHVIRWW